MQGFGMGRYVPPELEGTVSFNAASGKGHALGARARKLKSEGILTVRFELPFAVWCTNCQPEQIIGHGVRFNAEKKKIGNYFSTPILSFRFKHTTCGSWIEVRTDPKNTAYEVTEGGRRRDTGEDRLAEGEIRLGATEEEKERLEKEGAFGLLEKKVEDKKAASSEKGRIEELLKRSEQDWEDPYQQSKRLRSNFRAGRVLRKAATERTENLKDKLSLGIDLEDEKEEDALHAGAIDFGEPSPDLFRHHGMFAPTQTKNHADQVGSKRTKTLSSADSIVAKKTRLTDEIRGNTRAVKDPFLVKQEHWKPAVKRRKPQTEPGKSQIVSHSAALVNYDSD